MPQPMHPILEKYFRFIKRVMMSGSDDGTVGLDITPAACRAVHIRRHQDSFELVAWAMEPIEGADEKAAIIKVLDRLGPSSRAKPLVVSIGGKGTLVRHIDMPRMTSSDLHKAFVMEADKYFPFPQETVYVDCSILDPRGRDKKMSVLVAAVKKDIVDSRLKILKECGVEPSSVTVASIAIANIFLLFSAPGCTRADLGDKAVALVDIGDTTTNLMIMCGGAPCFTRDIFIGVADVARRLANMTGIPLTEARDLCLGTGAAVTGREEDLRKSLDAVFSNLVAEIRLSFDYFNTEKNIPIGRICLLGQGVYIPGTQEVLAGHFDIPLAAWNPAEAMHIGVGEADRGAFVKEGCRMAVALGLALTEYD